MISSTRERRDAGGEPGEPHQRDADDERCDPADDRGEHERRHVADVAVRGGSAARFGMIAGFSLGRHRQHAGRPRAERDEADVAEREHARVADEDVERDDDRDLHQRVGEVGLRRDRDERAEQRRGDDERDRPEQLLQVRGASYALHRPREVEEPARPDEQHEDHGGEDERRQVLALVRSAARRRARRVAKPIAKPPSVAGIGRFSPPTTTPASTTIVSRSAKSGVTSGVCTVSITATTAASAPEMSTANEMTRFARTPSMRAVAKSIDAARMCRPISVRSSSSVSSSEADRGDDDRDDRDLADVDAARSSTGG